MFQTDCNGRQVTLYDGDCVEMMQALPSGTIDLVIADPPYKLEMPDKTGVDALLAEKGIKLVNEAWDKFGLEDYIEFSERWILEAVRLLKPHGSLCIFGSYHNIGLVNYVLQRNKIMIINDIAWFKRNAVPNLACRRLQASYETILWAAPSKKYNFNYQYMKDYPSDHIHKTGKQMRNVWDIPTDARESVPHPTQKPIAVYERLIDMACVPGGVMLDPFGGSGTGAIAATRKGHDAILMERSATYCTVIEDRIRAEQARLDLFGVGSPGDPGLEGGIPPVGEDGPL